MELLGNKIRTLRKNKNLTQEELAQRLCVSPQAISKWERNISSPDIGMLPVISRFFGISMDELFSYRLDALTEKERFIRFLSDNGVLRFGEFPFRNGRISPYYISTERFSSGSQLTKIGEFYAACIRRNNIQPDLLLANTHKESHIVTAVGMTLYTKYGMDIPYCIRNTIGKASFSAQSITLLKDTMTSGNTLRAVMADIQDAIEKYPTHVVLSVDRLERGFRSQMTTANEIRQEFGVSVCAIVTVDDIICALENHVIPGVEYLDAMKSYRDTYRGI